MECKEGKEDIVSGTRIWLETPSAERKEESNSQEYTSGGSSDVSHIIPGKRNHRRKRKIIRGLGRVPEERKVTGNAAGGKRKEKNSGMGRQQKKERRLPNRNQ